MLDMSKIIRGNKYQYKNSDESLVYLLTMYELFLFAGSKTLIYIGLTIVILAIVLYAIT